MHLAHICFCTFLLAILTPHARTKVMHMLRDYSWRHHGSFKSYVPGGLALLLAQNARMPSHK